MKFLQSPRGVALSQSDVAQEDMHRRDCGLQSRGFECMGFGVLPPAECPIGLPEFVLSLTGVGIDLQAPRESFFSVLILFFLI